MSEVTTEGGATNSDVVKISPAASNRYVLNFVIFVCWFVKKTLFSLCVHPKKLPHTKWETITQLSSSITFV